MSEETRTYTNDPGVTPDEAAEAKRLYEPLVAELERQHGPIPEGASFHIRKASNGFLSRDSILDADDITYEEVDCKEWGGTVLVKSLNGRERAAWQQASIQGNGRNQTVNFQRTTMTLVALGVVDPETKRPLFTNADIARLATKNSKPLDRIAETVMRLSGITDEEMEVLTKNSEETLSDD